MNDLYISIYNSPAGTCLLLVFLLVAGLSIKTFMDIFVMPLWLYEERGEVETEEPESWIGPD